MELGALSLGTRTSPLLPNLRTGATPIRPSSCLLSSEPLPKEATTLLLVLVWLAAQAPCPNKNQKIFRESPATIPNPTNNSAHYVQCRSILK